MTPQERMLRVRLTEDEYKKLETGAEKSGFHTISEYVRYLTVGEGRMVLNELKEIKTIIKKLDKK